MASIRCLSHAAAVGHIQRQYAELRIASVSARMETFRLAEIAHRRVDRQAPLGQMEGLTLAYTTRTGCVK